MRNTQRILIAIYFPITVLIFILDNYYPKENMILYLKYTTMITLFLSALTIKKKFMEQKLMALSLFFLVIADFFLVFSGTIDNLKMNLDPFGILGFLCAYICLIVAYNKNFRLRVSEIFVAIPFVILFISLFSLLIPYIYNSVMKIGTIIFGIVLTYMAWTSVCTIFRNYFTKKASWIIAASGCLMFICDVGVAFSKFYPPLATTNSTWLTNIIWTAYVPGWTLLAVLICEEDLIN
ncbi:lysoplasmalogenase family protein [Clostridium sp. C2-6-12]|uniref:lysoplasmalogenase family protein n=1 Tax=Clostridium sp. C2-6-12 TaxID=2698832 RepID=UPI00136D4DE3|nr:lysoplasmalogenase family protein [Clostridium sp. C2-6-12]